jgi:AcrR family transcriptional regulator
MTKTSAHPREALFEAAEQLLIKEGGEAITTRRVAARAGLPAGLVHYHLGTMDALLEGLAGRVGNRLLAGQRALLDAPIPFADRWHAAVVSTGEDTWRAWMALRAMGWGRPGLRAAVAGVEREWRAVLAEAVGRAVEDAGVGPAAAGPLAAMACALLHGIAEERLSVGSDGHAAILQWSEGLLLALGEPAPA